MGAQRTTASGRSGRPRGTRTWWTSVRVAAGLLVLALLVAAAAVLPVLLVH